MSPEETATFRYVLHLIVGVLIVSILIVGCSRCVYSHYCENVLIVSGLIANVLQSITLYSTVLRCTTEHYVALHCTTLYYRVLAWRGAPSDSF